jgi:hypothetical protein
MKMRALDFMVFSPFFILEISMRVRGKLAPRSTCYLIFITAHDFDTQNRKGRFISNGGINTPRAFVDAA